MFLMELITKLFSVIFYFLIGYISKRQNILDKNVSDILIKFIVYISFPALVIYNIYHLEFDKSFIYLLIVGWFVIIISIILSFFIGKILKFDKGKLATFMMMSSFGNTSFLGFPFQKALLGEEALRYAVMFDQLASFLPVSILSSFILAYGKNKKIFRFDRRTVFKIITFPPFLALNLAFILKLIHIPEFILNTLKTLGDTVIPLALFSVGFNLRFSHLIKRFNDVILVLFIKMIFVPLIIILFLTHTLDFPRDLKFEAFILEISMPPMVLASIFVIEAKLDRDLAVSSVSLGIILSFLTVPLIMFLQKIF